MFDLDEIETLNYQEVRQLPREEQEEELVLMTLVFSKFALDDGGLFRDIQETKPRDVYCIAVPFEDLKEFL